jgi:hypothetical protein
MKKVSKSQLALITAILANDMDTVKKNTTPIRLSDEEIRDNNEMLRRNEDDRNKSVLEFFTKLQAVRMGWSSDFKKETTPNNISFSQAVNAFYGKSVNEFLRDIQVFQNDTIQSASERMGFSQASKNSVKEWLLDYSNIGVGSFASTKDIDPSYRFIIPEIILNAIRVGYEASARHMRWIGGTQNVSKKKITAPFIKDGDVMPSRINEGGAIPFGSLTFGQKDVQVFKVGCGFSLTDELIDQSSIEMMTIFLAQVGTKMSIGADVEAMRVLVNGDQANGSESAPVIGVETVSGTNGFLHSDIDNITMQMEMLNMPADMMIGAKSEFIRDLNTAFPNRDRETISEYTGLMRDLFLLPAGQLMFINKRNALAKLQYKGLMIETGRNIKHQEDEIFVTDHCGFMNIKRDARVITDRTVAFSSNGFPSYMDIETYLQSGFKTI